MDDFKPTKWWHVLDSEGGLWCETSNETEARESMRPGDELYRFYQRTESKWVKEE